MCLRQLTFLLIFCCANCCDLEELLTDKRVSVETCLGKSEVAFRGLANFAEPLEVKTTLNNEVRVLSVYFETVQVYRGNELVKKLGVSSINSGKINVTLLICSLRNCFEDSYVPREYVIFADFLKGQLRTDCVTKWDASVDQRIWRFLGWSSWSDWSPCSISCSTGIQQRTRHCLASDCPGFNIEQRHCNLFSCNQTVNPLALNESHFFHPSKDRWQPVPDRPTAWRLKPNSYIWVPSIKLFTENVPFPKEFSLFFTIRVFDVTMGTIFSLRSRRRQESYLSLEVAGSDLKLVHAAANGTDVIRIPTGLDDMRWHQVAISIRDNSIVESYIDCDWSRTDILWKHFLDIPEDSDLIIGYLFTGDLEQLTIVPNPYSVNLQCSSKSTPIVDPQIGYTNGNFKLDIKSLNDLPRN